MSSTMTIENGLAPGETVNPQTGEIVAVETPVMPSFDAASSAGLTESEINQQITTARKYPRSVSDFRKKVLTMCTLNEAVAKECIYAVPRGGKVIEGPSVRFAEIAQSAWGNCRVGGRIVGEDAKFVTAQGAFHDLESNSAIAMETRRRITDSKGKRYNDDMIGVTGAAAVSIAIRNSVLRGIPKALWADLYDRARQVVIGDFKTLANKRAAALQSFVPYGVEPAQIYAVLGIKGEEDITPDHLVQLWGMLNALKDGSMTPEEAFPKGDAAPPAKRPEKTEDRPTTTTKKAGTKKKDMPEQTSGPASSGGASGQGLQKNDDEDLGRSTATSKNPPPKAEGAKGDASTREGEEGAKAAPPGTTSPESTEGEFDDSPGSTLDGYLKGLASARSADEITGMRAVAKAELTPRELAVWQGAALAREQVMRGAR